MAPVKLSTRTLTPDSSVNPAGKLNSCGPATLSRYQPDISCGLLPAFWIWIYSGVVVPLNNMIFKCGWAIGVPIKAGGVGGFIRRAATASAAIMTKATTPKMRNRLRLDDEGGCGSGALDDGGRVIVPVDAVGCAWRAISSAECISAAEAKRLARSISMARRITRSTSGEIRALAARGVEKDSGSEVRRVTETGACPVSK